MVEKSIMCLLLLLLLRLAAAADLEVGKVTIPARTIAQVSFQRFFVEAPLVIITTAIAGIDPATAKLLSVTADGFEVVAAESPARDGNHGAMTVSYLAGLPGVHYLPDGHKLEIGSLNTQHQVFDPACSPSGVTSSWQTLTFGQSFTQAPTFIATLQTKNNEQSTMPGNPSTPWMVVGARSVTTTGADVALDRCGTGNVGSITQDETVGYVAMEPGTGSFTADGGVSVLYGATVASTGQVQYGQSLGSSPLVLASLNSRDEDDGGWTRYSTPGQDSVVINIDEDNSCDAERTHGTETASVLGWSAAFTLGCCSTTTSTSSSSSTATTTSSTTQSSTLSSSTTSTFSTTTSTSSTTLSSTSTTTVSSTSSSSSSTLTSSSTTSSSISTTSTSSSSSTTSSVTSTSTTGTTTGTSTTTTSSSTATTSSTTSSTASSTTSSSTTSSSTTSSSTTSSSTTSSSTTSSSATSTTTSTTSTGTTSTLTTTPGPPVSQAAQVENLLANIQAEAVQRFAQLANLGSGSIQWRSDSGVVQVTLINADFSNGSVVVGVEGSDVAVRLPGEEIFAAANLSEDESVGLLVSVLDDSSQLDQTSSSDGETVSLEVKSMVSIDIAAFSTQGARMVGIEDVTPIEFTLGSGIGSDLECMYWDTENLQWSSEGLVTPPGNSPDKPFTCLTKHLSLFGAILKGYTNTLRCTQLFVLFTQEAAEQLLQGRWPLETGSLVSWAVLLMLVFTFFVGGYLDARRTRVNNWGVEFFLVPTLSEKEAEKLKSNQSDEEKEEEAETPDYLTACICAIAAGCSSCMGNSACRDALDDIMSSWFEYFGDARTLCEELCGAIELDNCSMSSLQVAGFRITSRFLIASMRRLSGASLGLSAELVEFVLDDEDLNDFLVFEGEASRTGQLKSSMSIVNSAQVQAELADIDPSALDENGMPPTRRRSSRASVGVLGRGTKWNEALGPWEFWSLLHHEVARSLHVQSERYASGRGCLCMIWDLFRAQNPFIETFSFSPFMSCKMRALFFALDILGTMAISMVFFQATGSVKGKSRPVSASSGNCPRPTAEEAADVGYKLGRLLAVATGSLIVAGIPVAILASLHTRSFKRLDYPGSKVWRRQLRAWQIQDQIVWMLGGSYCLMCISFLLLFLANLSEKDHKDFAIGVVLVVGQVCIIIPMVVAIVTPTLAWLALKLATLLGGRSREDLVRRVNQRLYEESNVMLPIQRI